MKRLYVLLLTVTSVSSFSQGWFNPSLRRTFESSSKDENKPATLLFNRDFISKTKFFTLDMGLKISEFSLGETNLLIAPKLEYHIDKRDTFKINTQGAGLNLEWVPEKVPLWLIGSFDYTHDQVKIDEVFKVKANAALIFAGDTAKFGWPGTTIRHKKSKAALFRYSPSIGYERYNSIKKEGENKASYIPFRIYFDLWPFPNKKDISKQYILVTLEYTYRHIIDGELYGTNDLEWFSSGVTFFPEGNDKWGIGIDYSKGFDPSSNFSKVQRITYGLKIKI